MYREKNRAVTNSAKEDRKKFLEDKATEAKEAAAVGYARTLYKITREYSKPARSRNTSCDSERRDIV